LAPNTSGEALPKGAFGKWLVILFGIGCYIAGGSVSTKKIFKDSNIATLMWITEINRQIELQNMKKAEDLCFVAAQGSFSLLNTFDKNSFVYSVFSVCPWVNIMDKPNQTILTKAKIFYTPKASKMFPEAREYLNSIKEVPITTTCKLSTNTPTPQ
jgi:hypothetical protein